MSNDNCCHLCGGHRRNLPIWILCVSHERTLGCESSLTSHWNLILKCFLELYQMNVCLVCTVHQGAGEPHMHKEIQRASGSVAGFTHLVLHYIHLLCWRAAGLTVCWPAYHSPWQVGAGRLLRSIGDGRYLPNFYQC